METSAADFTFECGGETTSVADYFLRVHGIQLRWAYVCMQVWFSRSNKVTR
jgi:hypothetical protein